MSETIEIIIAIVVFAAIIWIANCFRRFISNKITSNKKLTERQFWRDPISTPEQAHEIMRRSSRDLIGLSILGLLGCFDPNQGINLIGIGILATDLILAIYIGRKSRTASLLAVLLFSISTTIETIALVYVMNSSGLSPSLLFTTFILITWNFGMVWMAWRSFQASNVLRASKN